MNDLRLQALSDELNDCVSVEHVKQILRQACPGEDSGPLRRAIAREWLAQHQKRGEAIYFMAMVFKVEGVSQDVLLHLLRLLSQGCQSDVFATLQPSGGNLASSSFA